MKLFTTILILLLTCTLYSQSYVPGIKENIDELRQDRSVQYYPIVVNDQRTIAALDTNLVTYQSSSGGINAQSGVTSIATVSFNVGDRVSMTVDTKPFMFHINDYYDSLRVTITVGVNDVLNPTFEFHIFRATHEDMQFGTSNSSNIESVWKMPLDQLYWGLFKIDTVIPVSLGKGNFITWGTFNTTATQIMKWNVNIYGIRNNVISHGLTLAASPQYNLNLESASEPTAPIPQRVANGTLDNGCFDPTNWNANWVTNICVSQSVDSDTSYAMERSTSFVRSGTNSLRAMVKATQPASFPSAPGEATHRSELRLNDYPDPGDETWYGFSYYFPASYVFSPNDNGANENNTRYITTQWQHGTAGSPSIAIEIFSDSMAIVRKHGTSDGGETTLPVVKFGKIIKGQWIDIILKVKWSKTDGEVQLWKDGENVYSDYYPTVYTDLAVGGSLKVGIYHFNWQNATYIALDQAVGALTREVYFDEVKQYTGPNGYRIVSPR